MKKLILFFLLTSCNLPDNRSGEIVKLKITYMNGDTEISTFKVIYAGYVTHLSHGCTDTITPTRCGVRSVQEVK